MPPPQDNRIRFDKTINLGHALTVFSFLIVALMQWNIMDKRVVVLEEYRISQKDRDRSQSEKDAAQDLVSKDKFQEVRDALTDLRRSVEKVADRVGAR
jgi:hypothetical protein